MSERRQSNVNWRNRSAKDDQRCPNLRAPPWRSVHAVQTGAIPKVTRSQIPTKLKCMDISRLETISQRPPAEALSIILTEKQDLLNYFKGGNILPDFITLLYEVLCNIVTSPNCMDVAQILVALAGDEFFKATAEYILDLPLEEGAKRMKNARFWADSDRFFLSLATTLTALLDMAPVTGADVLPPLIKAIVYSLSNFERLHEVLVDAKVHAAFEKLSSNLNQITEQYRLEEEARMHRKQQPPDNFRDIAVYPLPWEVNSRARSFLRKNIIKGAYDSVEHYLDVQFRLIREDFVAPLRDGICEYLEGDGRHKFSNIKIHKDVRCIGMLPNQGQMSYLLQVFNPKFMRNVENSRRFMYGSLVCLSKDYFNSILFGRIVNCDEELLSTGCLSVSLEEDIHSIDPTKTYTLAECTVYFEPYFHVLNALKTIQVLPMENYLVNVSNEIANDEYEFYSGEEHVKRLGLKHSQQEAYVAALSQEFCVIQGPPGTGKTHLCLHVTRELIKQYRGNGPILIICYTNHALDQFLEGLLDTTENMIRVGGQSKNIVLSKYNFKEVRFITQREFIRESYEFDEEIDDVEEDIDEIELHDNHITYTDIIQKLSKVLYLSRINREKLNLSESILRHQGALVGMISQFRHIINFEFFNHFNIDSNFRNSWFAKASPDELINWLLYQPSNDDQDPSVKLTVNDETVRVEVREIAAEVAYDVDDPRQAYLIRDHRGEHVEEFIFKRGTDYILCINEMYQTLQKDKSNLNLMKKHGRENCEEFIERSKLCATLENKYKYLIKQLDILRHKKENPKLSDIKINYKNPHTMAMKDRWLLYTAWLRRLSCVQMKKVKSAQTMFQELYKKNVMLNEKLDLYTFQKAQVIGMTTTSAARLHNVLQKLGCQIVIVEEAAEVLEAHIVTALSPSCRKLILVGDHKQLKPSTSDYKITREYNLGISLFERMVANGVPCYTLDEQHRMRPEIASLITPSIYPILKNAVAVHDYPGVRGFSKSLFFLTHQHREAMTGDSSKKNPFEAEYLIRLARHLVLNGYKATQITMIAAYSGQWFEMNDIKKEHSSLNGMRICILDNFQGEENDIILLSLVRNNEEGVNGFLNLENRVCVALSRARHGLYIMGNMPQLVKGSTIWRKVSEILNNNESLGEFLTVHCVNHPRTATDLREIADFDKVPLGGCQQRCELVLECGHDCKLPCHIGSHDNYDCKEPCTKVLCDLGHICPAQCYIECEECMVPKQCDLPCGHSQLIPCYQLPEEYICNIIMQVKLGCGHDADKPCHVNINIFKCPHPCGEPMKCGHACNLPCHSHKNRVLSNRLLLFCDCNLLCVFKVMKTIPDCGHEVLFYCGKTPQRSDCKRRSCCKTLPCGHECVKACAEECLPCITPISHELGCGHTQLIKCYENVNNFRCKNECEKILQCGHNCRKACYQTCGPCTVKVTKTIPGCGHELLFYCGKTPTRSDCNKNCCKALPCGHVCGKPCADECLPCMTSISRKLSCGHTQLMKCYENVNDVRCKSRNACQRILQCGHNCRKACYQTCGPCTVKVKKKIAECGHERMWDCEKEITRANCVEKCSMLLDCEHTCMKKCAENCYPCRVEVKHELICGHIKLLKCYENLEKYITLFGCRNVCGKILSCGHTCKKLCYETCDPCEFKVKKKITECGHELIWQCGKDALKENCKSEKCPKVLTCGHDCQRKCYEECEPCNVQVHKKIEECGHEIRWECGKQVLKENCKSEEICSKILSCGHACIKACAEKCAPCRVPEMRKLSCDHSELVECNVVNVKCSNICQKKLACGHDCIRECYEKCEPCKFQVNKRINECGHEILWACGKEVQSRNCRELVDNESEYPCGHKNLLVPCKYNIDNGISNSESHPLLEYCTAECQVLLTCGHMCAGTCGQCAQGRLHSGCQDGEKCYLASISAVENIEIKIKANLRKIRTFESRFQRKYVLLASKPSFEKVLLKFKNTANNIVEEKREEMDYMNSEAIVAWCTFVEILFDLRYNTKISALRSTILPVQTATEKYFLFLVRRFASRSLVLAQQENDYLLELTRFKRMMELAFLVNRTGIIAIKLEIPHMSEYIKAEEALFSSKKYNQYQNTVVKAYIETLCARADLNPQVVMSDIKWDVGVGRVKH